ncbi:MAG: hypothetical protein BWZ09_00897 [Alphaproteobacteria bacterium ADurb.BinA305]|nr:MAG: hypothetical protein BWZ09_00897 [Alphaproteobacteria bacterium ADurb.BinA305]
MRRATSRAPPASSASAEVSPRLPGTVPSASASSASPAAKLPPCLSGASAVAALMASGTAPPPKVIARPSSRPGAVGENSGCGATQAVISSGKDTSSATRASIAGLSTFWPRPPNTCLPTTIANAPPSRGSHHGAHGGRQSARISPVTTAEPSASVWRSGRLPIARAAASAATQPAIASSTVASAGQPNRNTPVAVAGSRASRTVRMTCGILLRPCTWGAATGERFGVQLVMIRSPPSRPDGRAGARPWRRLRRPAAAGAPRPACVSPRPCAGLRGGRRSRPWHS